MENDFDGEMYSKEEEGSDDDEEGQSKKAENDEKMGSVD